MMHDEPRKNFKKGSPKETTALKPKVSTATTGSGDPPAATLSLSKSLQAALVTTAGLAADKFQKDLGRCLQQGGKLNGPECRIESIMDIFLLPIKFLIRAV
jgi:hypothetical protein